jgi:TonB family protein
MGPGLILALLLQGAAPAPPPAPGKPPIVAPDWMRRPTGGDLMHFYPKAAARADLAGRAVISCQVNAAGALTDCKVIAETPTGAGFGEAAIRMSDLFKMRPQTKDGHAVDGGTVRIPMNFSLPPDLTAGPIKVRATVEGTVSVEVECRYRETHLDNCLAGNIAPPTPGVRESAEKLAENTTLPPTPRKQGRIRIVLWLSREGAESTP